KPLAQVLAGAARAQKLTDRLERGQKIWPKPRSQDECPAPCRLDFELVDETRLPDPGRRNDEDAAITNGERSEETCKLGAAPEHRRAKPAQGAFSRAFGKDVDHPPGHDFVCLPLQLERIDSLEPHSVGNRECRQI